MFFVLKRISFKISIITKILGGIKILETKKVGEKRRRKVSILRGLDVEKAKNVFCDKNYDRGDHKIPKGMKAVVKEGVKKH